jgi:hypothetical protein
MSKTFYLLFFSFFIIFPIYYGYLAWFEPKKYSISVMKVRRWIISKSPLFIRGFLDFAFVDPHSNYKIREARIAYTFGIVIGLFFLSAIFWSPYIK